MPSKRKHTKTRHGCKTCRERRVRCDLQRPVCRNCTKRKIVCGYTKELVDSLASTAAAVPETPSSRTHVCDVQLMHHYATRTYLTLSDDSTRHSVWQIHIPELAFKHDFLLFGIYAFTALHRSRLPMLDPVEKEALIALGGQYKHLGLSSYIPALEISNDDNCEALFAFSLLLGSLCLAELQSQCTDNLDSMILFSSLVEVSNLLSGSVAIADRHRMALQRGHLAPLLGSDLPCGDRKEFPIGLQEALKNILASLDNDPSAIPTTNREACFQAIHRLGLLYPPNGQSCTRAALIAWPVQGGKDFLDLMYSQDTLSLVCLAIYGAILHHNGHVWFLEGIGAKIVLAVVRIVPHAARHYLEWAMQTAGVTNYES